MKQLYIIRHAKSSWDDPDLADFERPLNERGKKDAPRMAKRLKEKEVAPDLVVSSPAARALATAKAFVEILGCSPVNLVTEKKLYHATADAILSVVKSTNEKHDCILLVGHNPGLTEFANRLANEYIQNIPTTGIVSTRLIAESWNSVNWGCGKMLFLDFPKKK